MPRQHLSNLNSQRLGAEGFWQIRYILFQYSAAGDHIFALYLVGTLLTIWHFTNGLNGFAWTWGIAVGRVAQKRGRIFAWVLFALMAVGTLNILFKMRFG